MLSHVKYKIIRAPLLPGSMSTLFSKYKILFNQNPLIVIDPQVCLEMYQLLVKPGFFYSIVTWILNLYILEHPELFIHIYILLFDI